MIAIIDLWSAVHSFEVLKPSLEPIEFRQKPSVLKIYVAVDGTAYDFRKQLLTTLTT